MHLDAKNAIKTGSLKITFALTAVVQDSLMSRVLVKNVLFTIAMFVTLEPLENARNAPKTDSYTTMSALESALLGHL
jgi:hypothetical protein